MLILYCFLLDDYLVVFFFFKQKTAYEMRISDWSSDVCSSDLFCYGWFILPESLPPARRAPFNPRRANPVGALILLRRYPQVLGLATVLFFSQLAHYVLNSVFVLYADYRYQWGPRSEEHTSELQSLMRISYAVFCLKKKKTNTDNRT